MVSSKGKPVCPAIHTVAAVHAVAACVRSARATPPNWLFAMRSVLVVRWAFLHVGTTTFQNGQNLFRIKILNYVRL